MLGRKSPGKGPEAQSRYSVIEDRELALKPPELQTAMLVFLSVPAVGA